MAMLVTFSADASKWPGGARYAPGKRYVLDRFETCLWIRRKVVDLATLEPCNPTDELVAASEAALRPGPGLSLAEVLTALAEAQPAA